MNNIFLSIAVLIIYILLWLVINLLAYYVSIALKTKKIFLLFENLASFVYFIFNFLLGIVLIWIGISLLINGHFVWLAVYLFIGASLISFIIRLFQFPFVFLTVYFSNKLREADFNENIATAEVIGDDGKVIKTIEGDTAVLVRMAKYFILLYVINLLSIFIGPEKSAGWKWGDYILWPFVWLISESIVIGILYLAYHKIRHRKFFPENKNYYFIQVWKICFYILLVLSLPIFLFTHSSNSKPQNETISSQNESEVNKISEKEAQIADLQEKAEAYRQTIESNQKKIQALQEQIDYINSQLNNPDLAPQDKANLLKQKNEILNQVKDKEKQYQELLNRVKQEKEDLAGNIDSQAQSSGSDMIEKYGGEVLQIGGIGSRITQKTAYLLTEQGYLSPAEDWILSSFNSPADIMDVDCREGYILTSCKIEDKTSKIYDVFGCRVFIKDKVNNRVNIECTKK